MQITTADPVLHRLLSGMTPRVLMLAGGAQVIWLLTNLQTGGSTLAEVLASVTVIALLVQASPTNGRLVLGYTGVVVVARAFDGDDVVVLDPYLQQSRVVSLDVEDVLLGDTSALALVG